MYHQIEQYYKNEYLNKVKIICRILQGDFSSAEDVVQEAFYRALKFHKSYDNRRGTIDKWFNSIMFNYLREHQKFMKNIPTNHSEEICPEDVLQQLMLQPSDESRGLIIKHIREVKNEVHRRVLKLFFINGYTSTEISQIESKMTPNNVTTIVSRFREGLINV